MNLSDELIREYRDAFGIPPLLLSELADRNALPPWANKVKAQPIDWLSELHTAVADQAWPVELQEARACLLERGSNLGAAEVSGHARAIVMPISTPAYLRQLLNIVATPMVFPESPDPEAKMLVDQGKINLATHDLARLAGMMGELGYSDSTEEYWGGAITLAARFLYYHELGHLVRSLDTSIDVPDWIISGEEKMAEELIADQFALSMMVLELRRHADLQPIGFVGVVLALSFVALKEFSETEHEDGKRRTKQATLRMHRLFYWGALSVVAGGIAAEAVALGKAFWECLVSLLRQIEDIPSPLFSLLLQTAKQPKDDWGVASEQVLKWCTFGDRKKVLSTVRQIRDSAVRAAEKQPNARGVLEVLSFLLADTAHLEPALGLRAALCD
jgi:hypothetical protein